MGSRINVYSVELVKDSAKVYELDKAITSPQSAYEVMEGVMNLSSKTKEHFVLMALNTKNYVVGIHTIHVGSLNASIVHPREVFQAAILNNAASIMVFHNHPSGDPTPSEEDIQITRKLKEGGKILGIELLDHIITGDNDMFRPYVSLREKGYI